MRSTGGNVEIIKIGKAELVVGGSWEKETRYPSLLLAMAVRTKASASGKHLAATYQLQKDKKDAQFALFMEGELSAGMTVGDATVARNIAKWVNNAKKEKGRRDRPAIFIHSVSREDRQINEARFWMVAVEANGLISTESQAILDDRFSLKEALALFSLTTENCDIVHVDTDGETNSFFSDSSQELSEGYAIHTISEDDFDKACKNSDVKIKRVYKPSKIKVKKVGIGMGAVAISIASFFGFSHFTQQEAISYFSQTDQKQMLEAQIDEHKDRLRDMKGSKYWDNDSYRKVTLEQFLGGLSKGLYKPVEVAIILREINRTLPMFATDWRLTKLSYEDNRFFARYERTANSKGVYFMLDEAIKTINKQTDKLRFQSYDLIDKGETRIYMVTPKIALERQLELDNMRATLREEASAEDAFMRNTKRLMDRQRLLSDLYAEYDALDFKTKWLRLGTLPIFDKVEQVESDIARARDGFVKSRSAYAKLEPLVVKDELVLGNVMDFVTMLQLDSFFEWSFPEIQRTYPGESVLDERNRKQSKKKTVEQYGPAIESYAVEISTRGSEEEGKVKSYGISDMIHLGLLINKPFINVDLVEYDKMSEQWRFLIHFHRKTPEYQQRIVNNTDKDVKS